MTAKIGVPASLYYYSNYNFWKAFFGELGLEVVSSPVTTKEILDLGVQDTVNDACVPIKVFHGHVMWLRDKVDYIFLPRIVSFTKEDTFCPKFLGLPDMVRTSVANLPLLISPRIDLKSSSFELWKVCLQVAKELGFSWPACIRAYFKASRSQSNYDKLLTQGVKPYELLFNNKPLMFEKFETNRPISLAILGYPYAVHDPFLSVNLVKRLESLKVNILTMEMISSKDLKRQAKELPKNLFWHYSNQVVRAGYFYLSHGVDGIIHVTAFGCGPDAMVDKLLELEAKKHQVPFMSLTIDEHSGEAGVLTRLEAFTDMIRLGREGKKCG